jgi:hypothetical protein
MSCPRDKPNQEYGNTLVFTSNSAGIESITNNTGTTLEYKLLAIEKDIIPNHESPCVYDIHKINFSCCSVSDAEYAHLYISTNILNQHCIILLANNTLSRIGKINDLIDKLYNSIERFKKQNADFPNINFYKQLRFHIYFYGGDPPLVINDSIRYLEIFTRRLEECLGYNKNELDSCVIPKPIGRPNRMIIIQKSSLLEFNFQ